MEKAGLSARPALTAERASSRRPNCAKAAANQKYARYIFRRPPCEATPSRSIRSECYDADRLSDPTLIDTDAKPLVELRPASSARNIANGDRNGLLLADENDEALAAGEAGVEQISL